jgi:predicted DNA-binding protein (UPF0251 family)
VPTGLAFAIVAGDIRDASGQPLDEVSLEAFAAAVGAWCDRPAGGPFTARRSAVSGLLAGDADPLRPVLAATLALGAPRARWSIAAGPAGAELLERASAGIAVARSARDLLIVRTGDADVDGLLDAIAPLLAELLAELTGRQREVARILILEGGRQADAADALGVSRATVSVMAARGRVRAIERLAAAVRVLIVAAGRVAADPAAGAAGAAGAATRAAAESSARASTG